MTISNRSLIARTLAGMFSVAILAGTFAAGANGQEIGRVTRQVKVSMSPAAKRAENEARESGTSLYEAIPETGRQVAEEGRPAIGSRLSEALLGFDLASRAESITQNLAAGERPPTEAEIAEMPTIEEVLGLPTPSPQETIFGSDNRRQVTATHRYPWAMNCLLVIYTKDGKRGTASGFLIGKRAVMTAGHCVHSGGRNGDWMDRIYVYPGRNGSSRPFGGYVSRRFYSNSVWTGRASSTYDPNYDYGCVMLSSDVGARTGYFGFANYSSSTLRGMGVNTAGYPGDKPTDTMWRAYGSLGSNSSQLLYHRLDVWPGQSGSAYYRLTNGSRYVVGIQAGQNSSWNTAQRVNSAVYSFMSRRRAQR